MEASEIYEAMLGALTDHAGKEKEGAPREAVGMMAIQPFDAETVDAERVKAIGVVAYRDMNDIDFVVLKTLSGGEIIPTTEGSLWAVEREKTE